MEKDSRASKRRSMGRSRSTSFSKAGNVKDISVKVEDIGGLLGR